MRPEDARALALAEELGAQLGRLKGAGPKLTQFLSVLAFDDGPLGALPAGARAVPFGRVKKVLEQDLDDRVGKLFDEFDEKPFALASLGQVHRARTLDGDDVAVKIQHPGVAEAVESDLRSLGIVGPILKRLAPGSTGARVLAEIRERIADELDYEIEAQQQRRVARRFRGHPHVRVAARAHRAVGAPGARDRLRGRDGLGSRASMTPNVTASARSRSGSTSGSRGVTASSPATRIPTTASSTRTVACACSTSVCCARSARLPGRRERRPACPRRRATRRASTPALRRSAICRTRRRSTLVRCSRTSGPPASGCWRRASGGSTVRTSSGSGRSATRRAPRTSRPCARMAMPAPTLLLRRMELQVLALLGSLQASADWGAIGAEYHSGEPPSTALGREDHAFFDR